jgi:hypothetical protein
MSFIWMGSTLYGTDVWMLLSLSLVKLLCYWKCDFYPINISLNSRKSRSKWLTIRFFTTNKRTETHSPTPLNSKFHTKIGSLLIDWVLERTRVDREKTIVYSIIHFIDFFLFFIGLFSIMFWWIDNYSVNQINGFFTKQKKPIWRYHQKVNQIYRFHSCGCLKAITRSFVWRSAFFIVSVCFCLYDYHTVNNVFRLLFH